MRFCEKLILLRKRRGLTQTEFSNAVGVSRQSVYKWESGQSYPEAEKLLEIRRLFGISIDTLLDESIPLPTSPEQPTATLYPKAQEAKEKSATAPHFEQAETPVPRSLFVESATAEPSVPTQQQTRKAEIRRPVSTPVSVQKKRKKPSTLREIVSAFFPKRR